MEIIWNSEETVTNTLTSGLSVGSLKPHLQKVWSASLISIKAWDVLYLSSWTVRKLLSRDATEISTSDKESVTFFQLLSRDATEISTSDKESVTFFHLVADISFTRLSPCDFWEATTFSSTFPPCPRRKWD